MRLPALAAAAALCLAALTACTDDETGEDPGADPTSESSSPRESPGQSTSESSGESPEPSTSGQTEDTQAGGTAVPAYWVGDGPRGPRLFREFARVDGDPLLGAARLVAGGGQPTDPDYRTLWPEVAIESVQPTDGLLLVTLADDGFTTRPDGMSAAAAKLAVQQMVYTLQGVQQERVPVQFHRPKGPQRLFGLSTEQPFRQAPALDVLSLVNITSPVEGETVSGDTLRVTGVANSFEAAGPCRVLVDGEVVVDGHYQSEQWYPDRLSPFTTELSVGNVEPGEATLRCETDDPSGGEGPGPFVDTRQITVE